MFESVLNAAAGYLLARVLLSLVTLSFEKVRRCDATLRGMNDGDIFRCNIRGDHQSHRFQKEKERA